MSWITTGTKGDNLDKVAGIYSCKRMTARWPMVVFFNILDVSTYNTCVVWMEVNPGWKQGKFFKRRLFLEVGENHGGTPHSKATSLPRTPSSAGLVRDMQGPEARSTAVRNRSDKRGEICVHQETKTSIMCHKQGWGVVQGLCTLGGGPRGVIKYDGEVLKQAGHLPLEEEQQLLVKLKDPRMLRLRCKTKNGSHIMQGLTHQSCVQELKSKVEELTGIPCDVQKIMVGYPPSSLDLRNGDAHLKDYPIKSGDTLIVEEEKNKMKTQTTNSTVTKGLRLESLPVLARRVVPADNSCLFTSVSYVVEGGVYDPACAPEMRGLITQIVSSDPTAYSEAVLGKTNQEYCTWIGRDDTWGGAIEVSILSKFYQCEICVVDTQTVRVDRFGEDAGYHKRVLLIYDGIHYDPLQKETPGSDAPPQTIFSTTDDIILAQALELADEARRKRQFTDVNRFALRCMVCQTGLVGQKEAREHAKETGHTNFGEV